MNGYNHVTLVGNICTDIEIEANKASFKINVSRNGFEKGDDIQIIAFNKLAVMTENYLGVGKKVLIEGHIKVYTTDGKWTTNIVADNIKFLARKENNEKSV